MPRPARDAPKDWSPEVQFVPIRSRSDSQLAALGRSRGLGFSALEWRRLRAEYRRLGREPSDVELAGLAQSWSEHCSYKSSKRWLRSAFKGLSPPARVLGTGDAGVMAFDPAYAYALRIESHNHPSAVEPYGGAATGIGGILRDVLAVGGRPIALADPLFFGPLDRPDARPNGGLSTRYLYDEVIAGIRDYGNRVGVPTVAGSIAFDPSYEGNPLVNVACLGFLPRSRLRPNRAERAGGRIVLVGGLTGRDGLGGVAFASRELGEGAEETDRGHVQLGNPIMKEPLIRACLEAYDRGLVRGVKDLGGGGLATASGELAHAGGLGLSLELDRVPLREPDVRPWEIWTSESQERMLLDVAPDDVARLLGIFRRYDVPATDLGAFVPGGLERILYRGQLAAELPLGFRVDPPLLSRPRQAPAPPRGRSPRVPDTALEALAEALILAPDSVSREPVIRVYDHEVQGHTVIKPLQGRPQSPSHGDAAVLRPRPESHRAIALTVASQPWACRSAPFEGAVWTVEEAARNLYAVGARPDALSDCLNFGNPERPAILGAFTAAVRGLAAGARALGFAVPSGNVSFYNAGAGEGILPTPVLMATGLLADYRHAVTSDLKEEGDPLYLLGRSAPALGGSLYARRMGVAGGPPPPVDPKALRRWGERLVRAEERGWARAVHDVSDGGLALTLFEMAAGGGLGFNVDLAGTGLAGPGVALAAEGGSRWVVEVRGDAAAAFERAFAGLPLARLGTVTGQGGALTWRARPAARLELDRLYERWRRGPAA
jgi:phosphoribosylformylglycinamidine synthase subunit PurL